MSEKIEGTVAVLKAGPEFHFPAKTPAGSAVATAIQRAPRSFEELRRGGADHGAWEKAKQMRDVPMLHFSFFVVLNPFLDGAVAFADSDLWLAREGLFAALAELGVDVQHAGCLHASGEQFVDDHDIHGCTVGT